MEKKYKHKRLGWIATKENQCYLTNANMGLNAVNAIPVELIENSCDWEEIIEKRDYNNVCFEVCSRLYKITKNKEASTSEYSIEEYQHGKIERANWDWNNIDENFKTGIWKEVSLEQYMAQFKKKLFTTEDGVDIFEGDSYYFVNKRTLSHVNKNNVANDINGGNNISFVYFSTEQKAKEYIDMNLPKYSEKDVIKKM